MQEIATRQEKIRQLQKAKSKLADTAYKLYTLGGYSYDYRFMQHIQVAIAGMLSEIALLYGQLSLPEDPGYENEDDTPF